MQTFTWLHISDLHFGGEGQRWLWPNFKHQFFDDVDSMLRDLGPCHAVVFSGDIVQSGISKQFDLVKEELTDLWEILGHHGKKPPIVCIPGNHDLSRPDLLDPIARSLRDFSKDHELREAFWTIPSNNYLKGTHSYFENYCNWFDQLELPKLDEFISGLLPGDFSGVLSISDLRIGFIGLNTSFLHLQDHIKEGDLHIHEKQVYSVCNSDPTSWCEKNDFNILVTHHGYNWLNKSSLKSFENEIAPPGRFLIHMYGHMHIPTTKTYSEAGTQLRRLWQAPSIFGLKKYQNGEFERIHGYNVGQINLFGDQPILSMYPRILKEKYGGGFHIVADNGYQLNRQMAVVETIEGLFHKNDRLNLKNIQLERNKDILPAIDSINSRFEMLESTLSESDARDKLRGVPRFKPNLFPAIRRVRQEYQSDMERLLRRYRCVWLSAEWGLGVEGFIASVLSRLETETSPLDKFEISCEEISDLDSFLTAAQNQLGISFQDLCSFISTIKASVILLNDVPGIIVEEQTSWFNEILESVVDYCPNAYIIPTTRFIPSNSKFSHIKLSPMSLPDVINFISDHPDGGDTLSSLDHAELLSLRSGGLPMNLDRLLRELKYSTVQDLLDEELDFSDDHKDLRTDQYPESLLKTVTKLIESKEKYSPRSWRLLKVLTILSSGATLGTLKRFYSTEPFWSCNPEELERLGLLNVISLSNTSGQISLLKKDDSSEKAETEKLLIIPRQVRDYVKTLISPQEKLEIVKRAADLYFGGKWREGNIALRPSIKLTRSNNEASRLDNEHTISCHLVWDAIHNADDVELKRALKLGIAYSEALEKYDRYRDVVYSTDEILHLLSDSNIRSDIGKLLRIRAGALRMVGRYGEAIELAQTALNDYKDVLSNADRSRLYMVIAFIHDTKSENNEAAAAAELARELCESGTPRYMQATAIIYAAQFQGAELIKKLSRLEKQARNKKYFTVANNIAIDMARLEDNIDKKIALHSKVINSIEDPYNRIRAVVKKAETLINSNRHSELNYQDRLTLSLGYSYLHSQRFGSLFNSCHSVIWRLLRTENKIVQLLRLFRHSSFLWRLQGQSDKEKEYLEQFTEIDLASLQQTSERACIMQEIQYLDIRRGNQV